MTRAKRTACRVRRVILIVGILNSTVAFCWIILPIFAGTYAGGANPLFRFGFRFGVLGGLLLLQWAFLRPRRGNVVWLTAEGRPLRSSVIVAALMAALLSAGAVSCLMELFGWWEPTMDDSHAGTWVGMSLVFLWAVWTTVFFVLWRQGDRYTQMGKVIRALVAGSLLEAFIAVPAHLWVSRQEACYCGRGSFVALVFSDFVLLWAFGPGVIMLFLRDRYRRERLLPTCSACGYSLRGLPLTSARCPECGRPFDDRVRGILCSDGNREEACWPE